MRYVMPGTTTKKTANGNSASGRRRMTNARNMVSHAPPPLRSATIPIHARRTAPLTWEWKSMLMTIHMMILMELMTELQENACIRARRKRLARSTSTGIVTRCGGNAIGGRVQEMMEASNAGRVASNVFRQIVEPATASARQRAHTSCPFCIHPTKTERVANIRAPPSKPAPGDPRLNALACMCSTSTTTPLYNAHGHER